MSLSGTSLSRRLVLGASAASATAAVGPAVVGPAVDVIRPLWKKFSDPFTLGVASGDPEPTSVVIWTRLAPRPFDEGHGMRGKDEVTVRWQVATDERMRRVVSSGSTATFDAWAHSVHVEVRGLQPGREYWYRFEAEGHLSPVGRTRTAPAPGAPTSALTFASISCQAYDNGFFTSFPHILADDPDFVMHLGDYVYEYGMSATAGVRNRPVPEIVQPRPQTLRQWRATHALYKSDPDLQALHQRIPMVITWDDHEYLNDYAGAAPDPAGGGPSPVRGASYQAYWEHQPLRAAARFKSGEIRLYRRLGFGDLLQVDMIDGRQFRSVPPCGWGEAQACEAAYDPAISMLGAAQERWLYAGLGAAGARWNTIGTNVMVARLDHDGDLGELLWNDAWDGFPAARNRLLDQLVARSVPNPVFVTGDWHSTFVNDIRQDFDAPDSPVVATEFVGTSVTTNGDGIVYGPYYGPMVKHNPHIRFFDGDRRGYQRHTLTHETWRTDLVMVDRVGTPTSPASVLKSFVVEAGTPGAVPA
jgi:alkaline phosphatase D